MLALKVFNTVLQLSTKNISVSSKIHEYKKNFILKILGYMVFSVVLIEGQGVQERIFTDQ